jgi:hypothetical protein
VIYVWCLERVEEKDREKWIADLKEPLPFQRERNLDSLAEYEMAQLKNL